MEKVTLNHSEMLIGSYVGARRRTESMLKGFKEKLNKVAADMGWNRDIEGAFAEMAVAKHLNIYYNFSVNTFKAPDVGPFQVRHTEIMGGRLILRPDDSDQQAFYLVVGTSPTMYVVGWIYGRDGKKDEWYCPKPEPPCWMVPQTALIPVIST